MHSDKSQSIIQSGFDSNRCSAGWYKANFNAYRMADHGLTLEEEVRALRSVMGEVCILMPNAEILTKYSSARQSRALSGHRSQALKSDRSCYVTASTIEGFIATRSNKDSVVYALIVVYSLRVPGRGVSLEHF